MAKRLEEQESESGGALLDDPSLSSPKNLNQIITEISNEKRNEINQNCIPRDGVIGGGSLIFDIDYSLPSMKQKNISRPYAYIKSDASIKNVMDLIINDWHLSLPRIILFLISDPDHFRNWNNYRQITSFKTGVMKAAKTTSMWLVTNGLDVGCGKLIGDALIDEQNEMRTYRPMLDECRRQFPVIGIANDNNLSYTQDLTGPMIFLNKTPPLSSEHHRYELNCMHTNFILLETENSSESLYQNFLINFIDYLNKKNLNYQHDDCEDHLNDNSIVENNLVFQTSSKVSNVNAIRDKRRESQSNVNSIIIRPSQGQSSDCFTPDDDMMDASQDDELDEDDYSFISPDGTIVEEQPSKRSHRHNFEADTPDRRISEEKSIPVVCLVIQGDYHCAKLVLDNIRRRNPVIVLRGSGGFADLLSFAYIEMQQRCRDLYQSWDVEFVEQALKPLLMQKIVKLFPSFRSNSLARNKFRDRIIECVRESNCSRGRIYLSILNMNNSSCDLTNLSEFILLSLFKSQNRRDKIDSTLVRKDLYLTLDWNCPIVALDEVLIKNPSFNLQLEKSIFEIAILKSNREEFVDLFLSHGFRVHKYLTPFRLIRLIRFSLVESDFFRFICMEAILGIAVCSGIVMQTLLYPNTELSLSMFHRAFHRAIVSLFLTPVDELTKTCKNPARMSDLKENSSWFISQDSKKTLSASSEELCPVSSKPMSESCPVAGFWSYVFTFQFLICLKLILMTLLYALFASTATKLQTETDNIWKYQRYVLVIDYANQSALSAPLSIFKYFYWIINCIFRCLTFNYCRWCKRSSRVADKTVIDQCLQKFNRSLIVFNWNAMSVNPAGLTIDRRSWIKQEPTCDALDCNLSPHIGSDDENSYLVYKLDEDEIPINLMGRTGLRGRGVLPRWGPNHYVLLLITRSRFNHSTNSIVREICLEHRYNNLFTPMRFIGDEKLFNDLKILFQQPQAKNWETEEDLYDFFKSIDSSVMIELPQIHYMDSPDNTDNAWKEVKIYHFHYDLKIDLNKTAQLINLFDLNTNGSQSSRNICTTWTEYSEDMLVQLPMEQIPFINEAIKRINNWDN
ncbi:hypothetical protein QR98_0021750 [Sarcoptes scabiei]|uniref:TRPM SLOG domain-containing protein n=1 Tax=Sarcoptes scabiei TaxID=52283 RepID=A0A131ZYJ3_SARSC|nr:hypothetical protein QR98_0021750 [Sarcoptes scabiei]